MIKMNTKNYLQDIYSDFFKVESTNQGSEIKSSTSDATQNSQKEMEKLFEQINQLYIDDDSMKLLKQIIEYMRKYNEKIENNYIPFNLLIETNNNDLREKIENILYESAKYFSYLKNTDKKNISLYEIDSNLDFSIPGMITIYDTTGLNLESDKEKNKLFYQLETLLKKNEQVLTIISGTNKELADFFLGREKIRNQYFDFHIKGINPTNQDIYQTILDNVEISDSLNIELLDYINKTYHKDCDYITYQNDLINYISFHKEIPKLEITKNLEEIFADLDELVGLEKVKKVLHELVDVMNLKEKAKDNLKINNLNLHMVFLGNPGTGKTTIARMISNILFHLNYIKENKLIEVSSKDLVAEYVGQTAPKTMQVIEKSLNGVLFIDEAYTLASDNNNSYNDEAIATLIQAMENYRDQLVVIFAGYTKEMQEFINSNPGIASRIGYTLEFDDYTTKELIQIFLGMMKKGGFVVEEDAINYLEEIINQYRNMKNFGNARFVRNIYEKTIVKHASRVKNKKQKNILRTITKEDISIENLILK